MYHTAAYLMQLNDDFIPLNSVRGTQAHDALKLGTHFTLEDFNSSWSKGLVLNGDMIEARISSLPQLHNDRVLGTV